MKVWSLWRNPAPGIIRSRAAAHSKGCKIFSGMHCEDSVSHAPSCAIRVENVVKGLPLSDPFRVGFVMGAENIDLDAVRNQIADHFELQKSYNWSFTALVNSTSERVISCIRGDHGVFRRICFHQCETLGAMLLYREKRAAGCVRELRDVTESETTAMQARMTEGLVGLTRLVELCCSALAAGGIFFVYSEKRFHQELLTYAAQADGKWPIESDAAQSQPLNTLEGRHVETQ